MTKTVYESPGPGDGTLGSEKNNNQLKDDEDYYEPAEMCCLGGCLTGIAMAFFFVLMLPAGILVSVYGSQNKDPEVLVAGVVMIIIPLAFVPVFIVIFYNRRKIRKFRKRRVSSAVSRTESANQLVKY